jgi:hypothetical protein
MMILVGGIMPIIPILNCTVLGFAGDVTYDEPDPARVAIPLLSR